MPLIAPLSRPLLAAIVALLVAGCGLLYKQPIHQGNLIEKAAADQLQSWASRVGAQVVRGPEGADPASVAFDAVDTGIEVGADGVRS